MVSGGGCSATGAERASVSRHVLSAARRSSRTCGASAVPTRVLDFGCENPKSRSRVASAAEILFSPQEAARGSVLIHALRKRCTHIGNGPQHLKIADLSTKTTRDFRKMNMDSGGTRARRDGRARGSWSARSANDARLSQFSTGPVTARRDAAYSARIPKEGQSIAARSLAGGAVGVGS